MGFHGDDYGILTVGSQPPEIGIQALHLEKENPSRKHMFFHDLNIMIKYDFDTL